MPYKKNIKIIVVHLNVWYGYWISLSEFRELTNHFA